MCMLTIRDNKLNVRHDDDMSSLVAEEGVSCAQKTQWIGKRAQQSSKMALGYQHSWGWGLQELKHALITFLCLYLNSTH